MTVITKTQMYELRAAFDINSNVSDLVLLRRPMLTYATSLNLINKNVLSINIFENVCFIYVNEAEFHYQKKTISIIL